MRNFKCIGFIFLNERGHFDDPQDYTDYIHRVWTAEEAAHELERGVLPPGMLIRAVNGKRIGVVRGSYNTPQEIVLLDRLDF